ncbi:MAG: hypothetical protein JEZ14_14180 [Marinilabiliaceae bacterium]|nr:hypothetical protein [Marinilabiliaceae bacterium]
MKKKVLRVIAGATLMVAMAVGMQMNNVLNESSLMMENLDAIAMASGESSSDLCEKYCFSNYYYNCWIETNVSYITCFSRIARL